MMARHFRPAVSAFFSISWNIMAILRRSRANLAFWMAHDVDSLDARQSDPRSRSRVRDSLHLLDLALDDPLGKRGDRQKWVDAESRGQQCAIGHEETLVYGAVSGEHATVLIDGAVLIVLADRATAERMRRQQRPHLEERPQRTRNEPGAKRPGVTPQLVVEAPEDVLRADIRPTNLQTPVRMER